MKHFDTKQLLLLTSCDVKLKSNKIASTKNTIQE